MARRCRAEFLAHWAPLLPHVEAILRSHAGRYANMPDAQFWAIFRQAITPAAIEALRVAPRAIFWPPAHRREGRAG